MSKEIHIYKAAPVDDRQIRPVIVHITEPIPEMESLDAAEMTYWNEADELSEALYDALPGGTFDRVLVRLMEIKATLFRVSHKLPEESRHASAT